MFAFVIGSLGFLCYFLYDINSIWMRKKILNLLFGTGCLLVIWATVWMLRQRWPQRGGSFFLYAFCGTAAVIFFVLLIYTLFFALPFQETYIRENQERLAYTEGVYALCRHPGVLWFAGLYLGLAGFCGDGGFLLFAAVMTAWNVLYVVFQDCWVFPKTFRNYSEYKSQTPFLLPTLGSLKKCLSGRKGEKSL